MSRGSLLLAIDQGTTNTKAVLVSRQGAAVFVASAPVEVSHPQPDWCEQDGMALWHSVQQAVASCLEFAGDEAIAAVGIANQRETAIAWDRSTGQPIAPAIVWQCRRSAGICDELRQQGRESTLLQHTGLGIDPLFSASKMKWLLNEIPGARARAAAGEVCLGTIDSWLIYRLTGGAVHACDASNASRTQLFDLASGTWSEELLQLFEIPRSCLPTICSSSGFFGHCTAIPALAEVAILSAIGDSHAALVAHGSFVPGTVKATYGTGSSVMTLLRDGRQRQREVATTVAWRARGETRFALEGNITMTGSAVQWVGEFLGLEDPAAGAARLAASVDHSAGLTFLPAMAGLGSPHWSSATRGAISGLSLTSRPAHLARAAVEAIAFQVRDVVEAMQREADCELPEILADGGATRNSALMQFQADILGRPVRRSLTEELSALGAAWLAGLALGWWTSFEELSTLRGPTVEFVPHMLRAERESRYLRWKDVLASSMGHAPEVARA